MAPSCNSAGAGNDWWPEEDSLCTAQQDLRLCICHTTACRQRFARSGSEQAPFQLVLIGKDGGVKGNGTTR